MPVYRFKPRKKPTPPTEEPKEIAQYASGEAFCVSCGHVWAAAMPTGLVWFECPSCHTHKGRWKFSFLPEEGTLMRECNCGNRLFYLTPEGHLCAECGTYQRY